jgi:hypothetical protein
MPKILIYNPQSGLMETYYKSIDEPMPYAYGNSLTVGEFRSNSNSNIIWTDKRVMDAWNAFRQTWGQPIYVGYAFKRIWQGGHANQSQHYAGTAFDVGQNLDYAARNNMRQLALNSGIWNYVEPAYLTPTWVHFDERMGFPACGSAGFPQVQVGSKGVYVLVLQDALTASGFTLAGLDGNFGPLTRASVATFQRTQGLPQTGIADCATWQALTSIANGIGYTGTVIN